MILGEERFLVDVFRTKRNVRFSRVYRSLLIRTYMLALRTTNQNPFDNRYEGYLQEFYYQCVKKSFMKVNSDGLHILYN